MTQEEYDKRRERLRMGLCPVCGRWPREGGKYCEACRPGVRKTQVLVSVNVPHDFVHKYCINCSFVTLTGDGQPGYCPFMDCPKHPRLYSRATGRPIPPCNKREH